MLYNKIFIFFSVFTNNNAKAYWYYCDSYSYITAISTDSTPCNAYMQFLKLTLVYYSYKVFVTC